MSDYAPGSRWELGPDGMLRRRVLTDQNGVPLEQGPIPAADPWVKIEPGCEMPEEGKPLVFKYQLPDSCGTGARFAGYWVNSQKRIVNPTHYAVLRMPEGK